MITFGANNRHVESPGIKVRSQTFCGIRTLKRSYANQGILKATFMPRTGFVLRNI